MDETKATLLQSLEQQKPLSHRLGPEAKRAFVLGHTIGELVMADEVSRLMNERDTWQHAATHDDLTGLLNRRGIHLEFRAAIEKHEHPENLAIAAFDLDKFKEFNDQHGHEGGDDLLKFFGHFLTNHLRREDEAAAHTPGRLGGDEFLALLDLSPREDDAQISPELRAISFEHWLRHGFEQELQAEPKFQKSGGFSIGIAFHEKGRRIEDTIREADIKLYAQKRAQGNGR